MPSGAESSRAPRAQAPEETGLDGSPAQAAADGEHTPRAADVSDQLRG
jgi:hypothetical protein